MIARVWTAQATDQNLKRYEQHFVHHVLPELKKLSGFNSAMLLTRESSAGQHEIVVQTFWQSIEAIDAFATPDREAAVVAPEATALLKSYDQRARHYTVRHHT
jgi:heme-degrading monooxygenase HmoA